MIEQFFKDWNTAIQSRQIVNEKRNRDNIIVMQETKFHFRDIEIKMYSRIVPSSLNGPADKRRWTSELFVPVTNKIIPATTYASKSKCAAAILTALKEGRDHEDRVEARNAMKRKQFLKNICAERKVKLNGTSFFDEEKDFIVDTLQANMLENHVAWDDIIISCLSKFHNYITGRGLIELGITLDEKESSWHLDRMYTTVVKLIESARPDKYGNDTIPPWATSRLFLYPKENISTGIYTVRSGFAKMFDECHSSAKFAHLVNFLGHFYAILTGVSLEEKQKEVRAREEKIREKIAASKMNGGDTRRPQRRDRGNRGSYRVSTYQNNQAPIGTSLGDVFGDVFDQIKTTDEKAQPSKTSTDHHWLPNKKHDRGMSNRTIVTNGQINGKMMETPKAVKTESKEELPEAVATAEVKLTDEEIADLVGDAVAKGNDKLPDPPAEIKVDVPAEPQKVEADVEVTEPEVKSEEEVKASSMDGNTVLPADFNLPGLTDEEEKPKKKAAKKSTTKKTSKKKAAKEADAE